MISDECATREKKDLGDMYCSVYKCLKECISLNQIYQDLVYDIIINGPIGIFCDDLFRVLKSR